MKLTYIVKHKTNAKENPPVIEEEVEYELEPFVNGVRNPQRDLLADMLDGNNTDEKWYEGNTFQIKNVLFIFVFISLQVTL